MRFPTSELTGRMTAAVFPYILNVSFPGTRAEVLLHMLEQDGIYVSTGSACSSRSKNKGSYVLRAMGLSQEEIEGAVRFSFSCMNTGEEIEETLKKLKDAVKKTDRCCLWPEKAERIADNGNAAGSGGKPAGTGVKNEIEMRETGRQNYG